MSEKNTYMQELMTKIKDVQHKDLNLLKQYCEELLSLGKKYNDSYAIAFAHAFLADYCISIREHMESMQHIQKTKAFSKGNSYQDLMMRVNNLEGLYHGSHFDEITAVQCFLNALHIAQSLNDITTQMGALNNIGILFEEKENVTEALIYVKKAFQLFLTHKKKIECPVDYIVVLNIIELYLKNNQIDEALSIYTNYYNELQQQIGKEDIGMIHVLELFIAYYQEDHTHLLELIDDLISSGLHESLNRNMNFSFYKSAFQIIIELGDKQRAESLLRCMGSICLQEDIEQQLHLHLCWIHFAETFHMEDSLLVSYKQYYQLQKQVGDVTNKFKADSMKEKILINEIQREKETIIKEKQELESQVKIDSLTKLFNRSYFSKLIQKFQNNQRIKHIGVILLDVDYFKEYNDYYGHYQGDEVLQAVAQCLDINSTSNLFASRYGGDEFICACVNMSDEEIEDYLMRVYNDLASLQIEHHNSKVSDVVTLSAGYYNAFNEHFQLDIAIQAADHSLYQSKFNGRNTFTAYKD